MLAHRLTKSVFPGKRKRRVERTIVNREPTTPSSAFYGALHARGKAVMSTIFP